MSLWDLFSSLFGRKNEEVQEGLHEEAEEIEYMAFHDQDDDAFAAIIEVG